MRHSIFSDYDAKDDLKTTIHRKGRTQAWLAEKLGCSQMTVYRLCNDLIKPKDRILNEVSELLDVLERALGKTNYKPNLALEYQTAKRVLEQIAVENPSLSITDRETLLRASIIISELL